MVLLAILLSIEAGIHAVDVLLDTQLRVWSQTRPQQKETWPAPGCACVRASVCRDVPQDPHPFRFCLFLLIL